MEIYSEGQTVVEPLLGLCTIIKANQQTILGHEQKFYELRLQVGTSVLKIPADQMGARGIRQLMSKEQIGDVLAQAIDLTEVEQLSPNDRLTGWIRTLRSGHFTSTSGVLKQLSQMQKRGIKLSVRELELQERVVSCLLREMAMVLGLTQAQARTRLTKAIEAKTLKA